MRNWKVLDQEQPCLQESAVGSPSTSNLSRHRRMVTKLFAHKTTIGASERLSCQKIGQEAFPKKLLQKKRDPAPAISLECAVTFREWRLNGRVFACGVP
ncbi:hypothetical protein M3A49_34010 [Paraburkholderia sp. CNPSo 3076]|uniref:hypothetical protein n=1 Tax=Paraburkholderia sp. CNPSo 3076 TaxID=2940936 RepID=UPI00225A8921|nr:hypothetical protein [Paraburkholderia sp. CNPSo 3076]MCX5544421.1 hypothetical protein [Paraburkholderia sp. CNPSo 3076]